MPDTVRAPLDFWTTRLPGTYLLLLHLAEPRSLTIGRLGQVELPCGWYVYVGSALGGLGARLRRHASLSKRHHWHIDTLRDATTLVAVAAHVGAERLECVIAARVAAWPDATSPVRRFGSSDCRCPTHLLHFAVRPDIGLGAARQIAVLDASTAQADRAHGFDRPVPGGVAPGEATAGDGVSSAGTGT